ncbi:hypothetical protein KO507_17075 [Gilvimarinus agarilyticus]|uniref:hypothetical protein n=1 Tax=Gilvimarinus sp. 2_MG-2023 TaxID=3062666 RepID=UPI001C0885A6|nr:hypothetical protein [Gilvimarinus sp. 2_MG-2023]MBU2887480.1 hypothetical protein [Gilvimarinus agarilyticus]MDO6572132.1 hypothetical protein [Gilvimarinus sp. 2_MG-2023]
MPQLSTGRHFCIAGSNFIEVLESGSDTQKHALTLTLRLEVTKPDDLLPYIRIAYFDTSNREEPPQAPMYDSGLTLGMIQRGESDWSTVEVEELNRWLHTNPQVEAWLQREYSEIDQAVRRCSIWQCDE